MRLAYGRLAQETNALSPVRTTLEDFRASHLIEDPDALARACGRFGNEAPGFLRSAELTGFVRGARGAQMVPLLSAWAVPSGPLSSECYETLRERLFARLRAVGPVDGVLLSMHGAMGVEGRVDPESDLLEALREVVRAPIGISLDLHANLTARRVASVEVLRGYHTNPHRDHTRTGARTAEALMRVIRGARPRVAWRSLPMLLGGGTTLDFLAPMRAIYARCRELERDPRVLTASVFMSHPWLDAPEVGWSTHVTTDGDQALADSLAEELAERCWAVREQQPPRFMSADEAIERAARARWARALGTVAICEASDVVSAGSTGESTHLLRAPVERGRGLVAYTSIRDPHAAIELFEKGRGAKVRALLGGRLDPARNRALEVEGTITAVHRGEAYGRRVALAIDPPRDARDPGRVHVVICEGPALAIRPSFYSELGLAPLRADVIAVKNLFPFRLFYLPYARLTLNVRTEGITDFDAAFALPIRGPVHPRDRVDDWRAVDRRRRAGESASP